MCMFIHRPFRNSCDKFMREKLSWLMKRVRLDRTFPLPGLCWPAAKKNTRPDIDYLTRGVEEDHLSVLCSRQQAHHRALLLSRPELPRSRNTRR